MSQQVRLLGIAPYENMKPLMLELAKEYDGIDLTVFVGDLQEGVELAQRNFSNDYDAIISRGGTASMLRERLDLPVIEIPISPFDIMRATKLAEHVSDHYAIVGFSNITASAEQLCQVMKYNIDIYSVQNVDEVKPTLVSLQEKGTQAILCDMVAHTTAMQLGLDVVLITSGAEGIRAAFEEALRLHQNYNYLRSENRFLRTLIWNQINQTIVFSDEGELFFSTLEDHSAPIVDYLREESKRSELEETRHILKQINNIQYSIRLDHETFNGHRYTTYYFSESRIPLADIRRGIRYVGRHEAEEQYNNSLYGIVGLMRPLHDKIAQLNQSDQPILVCGEDGTCKEEAVNYLYINSIGRNRPLVIIDCFMLDEKAWKYLMDHHNSPLTQSGCTIFFKNVDVLAGEKQKQLLANLLAMDVCKRNRMIFSCVCRTGEQVTDAGIVFAERLSCMMLYLPPTRQRASQLPAIANMYLSYLNNVQAKQVTGLNPGAIQKLQNFEWPHNYTQLQRIFKELSLMCKGTYITAHEIDEILNREKTVGLFNAKAEGANAPLNLDQTLDQINRDIILRVLSEENGNQSKTSQRLGIGRTTLWRILNKKK